jgi:plasmid stability protein
MPSVQIKNVPEDVHRTLRTRAAASGQSLQEFLLALLVEEASFESPAAIFDQIEREESGGSLSFEDAVAFIRQDRDSR